MEDSASPLSEEYSFGLFEKTGIELEYMIVHRDTLNVLPVCDKILFEISGSYSNDAMPEGPDGAIAWSNELALHVIEFKTLHPADSISNLSPLFQKEVSRALDILDPINGMLMPTAMHPWMNPEHEFKIWPHGDKDIYNAFDSIFSCKGHGWSNLQSMHINLPFRNNDEFYKLHAAIRFILPLVTALTASSPIIEGKFSGLLDTRMNVYRTNSARIPSLTAQIIPEPVESIEDYNDKILKMIYKDLAAFPGSHILSEEWVNSRGAIARFDRGSIEIRTADLQECPEADLACAELIIETLKALVYENYSPISELNKIDTTDLYNILMGAVKDGENTIIKNRAYLGILNMPRSSHSASEILYHLFEKHIPDSSPYRKTLHHILKHGSLSTRITKKTGPITEIKKISSVYNELCFCLKNGNLFV